MQAMTASTRGILSAAEGARAFDLVRHLPSPDLAFFVERYWIVTWDLRGREPYTQEVLPYPCVNMAIEQDRSGVFGLARRRFTRTLEGAGRVFAVKFRPGGYYPFHRAPIAGLTDRTLSMNDAFGEAGTELERTVLMSGNEESIAAVERFLRPRLPEPDDNVALVGAVVACIEEDRTVTTVDELASRFAMSPRALQRLFHRYVGIGPKWTIRRFRLQEAAELLERGASYDWAALALDLGYFDQAHFIHDFKSVVGATPRDYGRRHAQDAARRD